MEAIKRIVELNEAAAIGLHEGSIDSAVLLLRDALNLYRVELTGANRINFGSNSDDSHDNVLGVLLDESLCKNDGRVAPDNIFSAFNCAFCFMKEVASVDSVAVIVLYNYGLALHRRGMIKGNNSDLQKALQLYSMAYGLLQDDAMSTRYELGRVGLALLSNQAQLFQHFLDHERVHYCVDRLQVMLERRNEMSLTADEFSFFFHVVFFSSRRVAASPAA